MRPAHPPQSPQEAIAFLTELDPPFETELEDEDPAELNYHRIIRAFAVYFAANRSSFSPAAIRRLGNWINVSVEAGGEIENAISTCFLEHARQLGVNRVLAPYLSTNAKRKTHA